MDIEPIIRDLGWTYSKSERAFNLCCPLAPWTHEKGVDNRPSSVIKNGIFHCFCCGETYPVWLLFDALWLYSGESKYRELAASVFTEEPPVDVDKIWNSPESREVKPYPKMFYDLFEDLPPRADEYLLNRGISLEVIKQYGIKYDPTYERIVFPCFMGGLLYGAQGRTMSPTVSPKYFNYWNFPKNLLLGGLDNLNQPSKLLFVFEGWPGMLRFKSFFPYIGVLCSYGSHLSHTQAATLASLDKRVILCFDNDDAGQTGARKALSKYSTTLTISNIAFSDDIDCLNQETLRKELKEKNINV